MKIGKSEKWSDPIGQRGRRSDAIGQFLKGRERVGLKGV